MTKVKLAIIYYSSTGTNYTLAQWAKEKAEANGAEVRLVKVPELAPEVAIAANPAWKKHYDETQDVPEATSDDITWADALLFSMPSRFGVIPSQLKQFIDSQGGLWASGATVNKVVSGMSSAQNPHGGQEATILSLYTQMFHWGAIIAAPGYSDPVLFGAGGNPYGTSVTVDQDGNMLEDVRTAVEHQVTRTLDIASRIVKGND
ncbi:NAD(P)H:quinone oxidoreductase type IV [Alkalibacterium sp. MB6]|uniref:NAD(P)H:quinone oxidoreductase type IV n=1 Tax=Alkalibacterium sp. MB6 TaxID=2081965 RepID=UPI00137B52E0|nr:NAD(P)H:quinone oxidoreductase type IV [Alkalibacterium sp. MB6]